jgi:hypothetical protein
MRAAIIFTFIFFSKSVLSLTNNELNLARSNGLYFALIPTLKNKITNLSLTKRDIKTVTEITESLGGEQFEQISSSYLGKINSGVSLYLSAKQLFKDGKFSQALGQIKRSLKIRDGLDPFKYLLAGSASVLLRNDLEGKKYFNLCLDSTRSNRGKFDQQQIFNQELGYAYDSCLVGLARIEFQLKNFSSAKNLYGNLKKSSLIWPEILFEEAWNSFYENDFNRTLGKLITYNSPFIAHVFNPEVEVLNAMTYLELCRYDDAKKTVNDFYKKYKRDSKLLTEFNSRYRRYPSKLGKIAVQFNNNPVEVNKLLSKLFRSLNRDLSFQRMRGNLIKIKDEIRLVKNVKNRRLRSKLAKNLKQVYLDQIKIIGRYSQRILRRQEKVLEKSMIGMSYINLEIIKKLKRKFFAKEDHSKKIGNIKNLKRDSGQYLWDFNGEFWADELGDYVFSLKSSCG